MAKKYIFRDTDATGTAEYDIAGDAYSTLLETCFRYSAYFSVLIHPLHATDISALNHLEACRLPLTETVESAHPGKRGIAFSGGTVWFEIRHYELTPQSCQILRKTTDSLFKWIDGWGHHNPEDLTFHRADGSVFFSSTVHDGECALYPTDAEDVSAVLEYGGWEEVNG